MSRKSPDKPLLALTHGPGPGRYVVELEAFFDLSFALAEQLENLVDDWSYFARKRANSPRCRASRSPRAKH